MPLSRLALVSSKPLCPLRIKSSRMKPLIRSTVLCQNLTVGSFVRHLSSSPHLHLHREVTVPKDFPTSGIAINTRVRKLNFPPFVKDLYCGVFNKSVLSFAEVLSLLDLKLSWAACTLTCLVRSVRGIPNDFLSNGLRYTKIE